MKKRILLIPLAVAIAIVLFIFFMPSSLIVMTPKSIADSDGNPSSEIVQRIVAEDGFEDVILKLRPFGYVTVQSWGNDTESFSKIKRAAVSVLWRTDANRGAGNIYVGYSTDNGASFVELGPFNESETVQNTTMEFAENFTSDIRNLQVRWRGEDLDYRLAANGYVSFKMNVYA
jgi:hypothetical protein